MKYLSQTFSYLRKNFLLPTLVMIVPAVVACFLSTPYWEVSFASAFNYDMYRSAGETFRILFGDSWQYFWPVIVIAVFQVVGASLVMSAIDRHFRTGRLSLRNPLRLLNNSIAPMAIGVIVMSVFSIIWRFVLFGLVSLAQGIGSAAHLPQLATLSVISIIAIGMFILHVLIFCPMLYWAPIMFIYGHRFRDAAAASFKLISSKKQFSRLFWQLVIPLLPCAVIQMTLGYVGVPLWAMRLSGFFVFLYTNVYVTVYAILTFYRISDLDRRDVKFYAPLNISSAVSAASAEKQDGKDRQDKKADEKLRKTSGGDAGSQGGGGDEL